MTNIPNYINWNNLETEFPEIFSTLKLTHKNDEHELYVNEKLSITYWREKTYNQTFLLTEKQKQNKIKLFEELIQSVPQQILEMANKIKPLNERTIPCKAHFKNGEIKDFCTIIFDKKDFSSYDHLIDEIDIIEESEFALPFDFRKASNEVEEFRNSLPFYIQTKDNTLLSYEGQTDFISFGKYKGSDALSWYSYSTLPNNNSFSQFGEFINNFTDKRITYIHAPINLST